MRIKILHVINSLCPGGAEILLTNSLSPGGLNLHVENHLAYFMKPSYLLDKLDKEVRVHFLNYKGGTDIIRLLLDLKKVIVENNIDIVHSHLNPASLYTHLVCPKNIPQVHTIHTTYSMDRETKKIKLWLEKYFYLLKKNTNVILLSDFIKEDFLTSMSFKGKSFVLNNFVADNFFNLKIDEKNNQIEGLKLVAIGSLRPLKNFNYLIDVFKLLKNRNITLDIYGAGNKTAYETVINETGVKVKMMGHVDNIENVIPMYDMFIMPSKFEGFPLSVFEAMAAGLPVMLSDIAPLKSIVKENAIYFNLNNAQKTADQLSDIFKGVTEIKTMALKSKEYAEKTVRRHLYIQNLLNIYNEILS